MTSRPSAPLKKVEQDVVTVRVRCVGCGKTRDAAPEEWKADGVPFCAYCHMPMATVGPVTVKFAQRKLAEDSRLQAETSRASADNAYREHMRLDGAQFVQLESIKRYSEACKESKNCFIVQGNTPVLVGR